MSSPVTLPNLNNVKMANQTGQPSSTLLPNPPPVPHYDAVPQEVENFLKEYFKSQLCLSDTVSLEMAQKLPINGPALFKASEEKLQEVYGLNGSPLFDHLQDSIYGRVCTIPYLINCFPMKIV